LRLFFERSGGAFIKFGQILALRQDVIPPDYSAELLKLLSNVPPAPFAEIHKIFIEDIGLPFGKFFKKFDTEPVASASIGQVYRAEMDGIRVAVKIRRPGVAELFESDFLVIYFLASVFDFFTPFSALSAKEVADDFIRWTRRELDFRYESQNGAAFYEHAKPVPATVIPKQYPQFTSSRVLIQEFMEDGIFVLDLISGRVDSQKLEEKRIQPAKMTEYMIKEAMRQYFIDGFFHADAHPANLILLPAEPGAAPYGKLAYLDFGIVGEASPESRLMILKFAHALANKDLDGISRHLLDFGAKSFEGEVDLYLQTDLAKQKTAKAIFDEIRKVIFESFKKEIAEIAEPWFKAVEGKEASLFERSSSVLFLKLVRKAENFGAKLPIDIILFFRSIAINDLVALQMSPGFDMIRALKAFFGEYPVEKVEEVIKAQDWGEIDGKIVSVTDDWEEFLQVIEASRERSMMAKEKVLELAYYYAERYPEVRKLLKKL